MPQQTRDGQIASSPLFKWATLELTMDEVVNIVVETISQTLIKTSYKGVNVYWYGGKDDPDLNAYDGILEYWSPSGL